MFGATALSDGTLVVIGGFEERPARNGAVTPYYHADVWKSSDRGRHWSKVLDRVPWAHPLRSTVSLCSASNNRLVACFNNYVYTSSDCGASWACVASLPFGSFSRGLACHVLFDRYINRLLIINSDDADNVVDIWESFDDKCGRWTRVVTMNAIQVGGSPSAAVHDGKLVIVAGGANNQGKKGTAWVSEPDTERIQSDDLVLARVGQAVQTSIPAAVWESVVLPMLLPSVRTPSGSAGSNSKSNVDLAPAKIESDRLAAIKV
jgi:hypothetical protein